MQYRLSSKLLWFFVLCLLILCGCNSNVGIAQEINKEIENDSNTFESSGLIEPITSILRTSFSLETNVSYDAENNLINISVTAPKGTANAIVMNKAAIAEDWAVFRDSIVEISESTYILCLENGYKVGCTIMVFSDANPKNIFLSALNGKIFYDVMNG